MFKNFISFALIVAFMLVVEIPATLAGPSKLSEAVSWLENESNRLIRASKRTMKDGTAAFPPQVGIGYEAFWLRDFAYTLEGSLDSYSEKELLQACRLFIRSIRADGAGVDCVAFDDRPIYKPGFGTMGANPVADGSQFSIAVAWHTYQKTKDSGFLKEIIDDLVRTMNAVPRNPKTGLVHIKDDQYDRCPYGFTDTVRMQGDVLLCSLLYVEAGRRLSDLLNVVGLPILAASDDESLGIVIGRHDSDAIHPAIVNHPTHDRILLLGLSSTLPQVYHRVSAFANKKNYSKYYWRKVHRSSFLARYLLVDSRAYPHHRGVFLFSPIRGDFGGEGGGGPNTTSPPYIIGQFNSHFPQIKKASYYRMP